MNGPDETLYAPIRPPPAGVNSSNVAGRPTRRAKNNTFPGLLVLATDQRFWGRTRRWAWGRKFLEQMMPFMIIERFKDNNMLPIYKRVGDEGRLILDGLKYVDRWVEPNFSGCDDLRLLQEWILNWRGAGMSFELVPVLTSKETREVVALFLDEAEALDNGQSRAR